MIPAWLIFALISPAIQAFVNFTDKYIISSRIKDYRAFFMYGSILAFIIGVPLWALAGFPILKATDAFLVILTGVFSIWGSVFYFKALQKEHTSTVVFLFQLIPILVLIMSAIFLKESLSLKELLGFFLILVPALLVSNEEKFIKINNSFLLVLTADILWALAAVIFKFVIETNDFFKILGYESIGWTIGGIIVFLLSRQVRKSFFETTKSMTKSTLGVVYLNETIWLTSKFTLFLAISLGSVSLVSVVASSQVFFAITLGWLLTLLFPQIFKENISRKGLLKKFSLAIVAIIGIALIS